MNISEAENKTPFRCKRCGEQEAELLPLEVYGDVYHVACARDEALDILDFIFNIMTTGDDWKPKEESGIITLDDVRAGNARKVISFAIVMQELNDIYSFTNQNADFIIKTIKRLQEKAEHLPLEQQENNILCARVLSSLCIVFSLYGDIAMKDGPQDNRKISI